MTSGNFTYLPVSSIIIEEDRQRRELGDIDDLAESIRQRGLINPILITRENVLVAGERRLQAHKVLLFDQIAVQYTDEIDPQQLQLIELEENIKRKSLEWQEHNDAVAKFHQVATETNKEWSAHATAEALNMSDRRIGEELLVNRMRKAGVTEVSESPKFSSAVNFARRKAERQRAESVHEIDSVADAIVAPQKAVVESTPTPEPAKPRRRAILLNTNFLDWSKTRSDIKYNFIHCDFPYGVDATKIGQSGAKNHGGYEDTPEIYWNLLNTMLENQDNFIAPSAHMMFWYSMNYHSETIEILQAAGWKVNPFPLIWHKSDDKGIIPDTNRYGRRTYETALFASRGDRKIVSPVSISYSGRTTKEFHMSEKPHGMLEHFFRMIVDESTLMLDPTAGSGMAVRVAEERGAKHSLGLEMSKEYYLRAKENLKL